MSGRSVTDAIVERLKDAGASHIFGVPGGECNLDFIASAEQAGVRFVLTRTETAATIMASVAAEITGGLGVAMTTRGPGIASAMNGVSYALLDRAPVLVMADGYEDDQGWIAHQRIDQMGMLAPITKAQSRLATGDPLEEVERLIEAAFAQPPGPVYLETAGSRIRTPAGAEPARRPAPSVAAPSASALEPARAMLKAAKKPMVMAGLQARTPRMVKALRDFVAATGIPVLTTYKAKGVADDDDPLTLGHYMGGVAEEAAVNAADLIILYGFDTVEGPPSPWRYKKPLLELTLHPYENPLFTPDVSVVGDIAAALSALTPDVPRGGWSEGELATFKTQIRERARLPNPGINPSRLVESALAAAPRDARITIDAGAHMLPVLHLWRTNAPNGSLISRGLSTMGFALPAVVASSIVDPSRPSIAFTGDGGLMMCMGELGTAAQQGAAPIVVVFNDACLSLIGAKQQRRQLAAAGVDFAPANFAKVASGFGWNTLRVEEAEGLDAAMDQAMTAGVPTLIDVVVDPAGYPDQILALRG